MILVCSFRAVERSRTSQADDNKQRVRKPSFDFPFTSSGGTFQIEPALELRSEYLRLGQQGFAGFSSCRRVEAWNRDQPVEELTPTGRPNRDGAETAERFAFVFVLAFLAAHPVVG